MARSHTRKGIGKDADYLADLHNFPCAICFLVWYRRSNPVHMWHHWLDEYIGSHGDSVMGRIIGQKSDTEAAHVGDACSSKKCPDKEAIALCGLTHHREAKGSEHNGSKDFFERFGVDRSELIERLNRAYGMGDPA